MNILGDLTQYYRIRMSALSKYSNIVWNRFNWFLTLSVAIFGLYFNKIEQSSYYLFKYGIPTIGIVLSILWFLMGIEDYFTLQSHKKKVSKINKYIKDSFAEGNIDIGIEKRNFFINFSQSILLYVYPLISILSWVLILCQRIRGLSRSGSGWFRAYLHAGPVDMVSRALPGGSNLRMLWK